MDNNANSYDYISSFINYAYLKQKINGNIEINLNCNDPMRNDI